MSTNMGNKTRTHSLTASIVPTKLCGSDENRKCILIYNAGSVTIYITAKQANPYTQGIPIVAGATYVNNTTTDALWVLTSTSTADVRVQEDGN